MGKVYKCENGPDVTEEELLKEFLEKKSDPSYDYADWSFTDYIRECCCKNGTLTLLTK